MPAAKARVDPADPMVDELDARREYLDLRKQERKLVSQIEQLDVALQLTNQPEPFADRARAAVELAGLELALAKRNPRRTRLRIEELRDELVILRERRAALAPLNERWETNEAVRIARALQPEHKAAVRRINDCLEALSTALAAEIEVRDRFAAETPTALKFSSLLPNASATFMSTNWIPHRDSRASVWARDPAIRAILNDGK